MKKGDIVRFVKWEELSIEEIRNSRGWSKIPKKYFGVLVEHDKLMGTAHVMHEGEVLRVRSVFVEKAGKKDLIENDPEYCGACGCTPCDCGFGSY